MPNRILKESICTSDSIDQLSAFQETMFYRMIVNCDDYGRMDARAKILASRLFPLKDIRAAQIEDAIRALTSAELVILYEVDGKPFLQMKTWDKHQQIRAKKSKYPAPNEGICKQMISDDSKCPRNPIQSESESESNTNICAAASAAQVATLTLLDGSSYVLTEDDAEKDRKAYPAVDVVAEYQKMSRWLDANQKNRKTKSGIKRFVNSWLSRAQNSARTSSTKTKTVSAQNYNQRSYSEDELLSVSDDLIAEARSLRGA
jgi:hypothetical protein